MLPDAVALRDHVLAAIREVYTRFGYRRIETPALENIERLRGGQGGENEKLIYRVLKRGLPERTPADTELSEMVDLGLRFDLTVPLTRFYGNNHANLPNPFRSFQFGPVWRAERPQKGRYRQFYQCDIDMIGEPTVLAEVELIEATTEALATIGLADTTVRLSDRRFLSALAAFTGVPHEATTAFFTTLDKLDKIGWSGVRAELCERGIAAATIDAAVEFVTGLAEVSADKICDHLSVALPSLDDSVITDLDVTTRCLTRLADQRPVRWEFDPTLVRGMGYYTGQIFEIRHPDMPGSVAGGGRYDTLIGRCLNKDVPACGFSIGFERIVDLLAGVPRRDAIAVLFEPDTDLTTVFHIARDLRAQGRDTAVIRRQGKFAAQLTRLTEWGFTSFLHLREDTSTPEERPLTPRT